MTLWRSQDLTNRKHLKRFQRSINGKNGQFFTGENYEYFFCYFLLYWKRGKKHWSSVAHCAYKILGLTVASLQILHFTTCWCVLPSTDMALWQTRQKITGALLLSGLPCGEYGGGGSPGTSPLGNGARPKVKTEDQTVRPNGCWNK